MMDQDAVAAAVIATINAALPSTIRAYDYDDVPSTRPPRYVVIDLSRRFLPGGRVGGIAVTGGRLGTRYVAQTVGDARELRRRVTAALEEKTIVAGAEDVGPFVFETEDPIVPDEGWYSGSDVWIF